MFSQNTIQITTDQAKEAIRNAQRVESLEASINQFSARVMNLQAVIVDMKQNMAELEKDRDLWKSSYYLLEKRHETHLSTDAKKRTWLKDLWWFLIGAVASALIFT